MPEIINQRGVNMARDDQVNAADTPSLSDTVDLVNPGLYLYVGASGDLKVTTVDNSTFTMVGIAAGVWHKIPLKRIWATGATATDILVGR
jgi:hypothetical protein